MKAAVTLRLPPYLHLRLAAKAKAAGTSLNAWMLLHLEAELKRAPR